MSHNTAMPIPLLPGFFLTELRSRDRAAIVEHLQSREIYEQTLRIPWPYTLALAGQFLQKVRDEEAATGRRTIWGIRARNGLLVGVIGLESSPRAPEPDQAEIGYWIARRFWNRGLATQALQAVVGVAFERYKFAGLKAGTFPQNAASRRVLEKCGFRFSGLEPGVALKHGRPVDLLLYVLNNAHRG